VSVSQKVVLNEAVTIVKVGGVGELQVLAFHPLAITVLEGVIKTHSPIFTAIA
jgi:hypothetical protein